MSSPSHRYRVISDELPAAQCYPKTDSYTFGEFAGPVIEYGGYADMTMVDPYTSRRLWVADVFASSEGVTIYQAMRQVIDVAEQTGFMAGDIEAQAQADGDEHTPTGPVSLHHKLARLIERYGIDAVEATFDYQAEVLDDQAGSSPELAARVRQSIDQANGPERGRDAAARRDDQAPVMNTPDSSKEGPSPTGGRASAVIPGGSRGAACGTRARIASASAGYGELSAIASSLAMRSGILGPTRAVP